MQQLEAPKALGDLKISLDAFALDVTAGKRKLESINLDGSLIFEEPKDPEARLTEDLVKIWNEYPGGLMELTGEKLGKLVPDALAVQTADESVKDVKARDRSKMMTSDEMEGLRSDLFLQLNEARNELWFVLELAKTLSTSSGFAINPPRSTPLPANTRPTKAQMVNPVSKPQLSLQPGVEPPILPPGTFTSTPSLTPPRPTYAQVLELELALQAKQKVVEECSEMIDAAVEELQTMAKAGERYWRDVRELKDGIGGRGRWAVVARPDFGRNMKEGEGVRDVVIPYAIDEAPPGIRGRSLAAFDLDPAKEDALTFGARNYQRMQVTLSYPNGQNTSSTRSKTERDSIGARVEDAQVEAFDEDLFNEIRGEALRTGIGAVEPNKISIDTGGTWLTFSLYDTRSTDPSSSVAKPHHCDLILHSVRLSLLNVQKQRKRRLTSLNSASQAEIARSTSLVEPIIQVMQYLENVSQIKESLFVARGYLQGAGIQADILERRSEGDVHGPGSYEALLRGERGVEVSGGVFTLDIPGSQGCSVSITAPNDIRITTSQTTLHLTDPNELPHVLANDISAQVLGRLSDACTSTTSTVVFLDTVEGSISLIGKGTIRVSIPAPFDAVLASFEPSLAEDDAKTFAGAGDLCSWAQDVAQ